MANKIFTLTNLSPIGFKQFNYPTQYCAICRGLLIDVCSMCIENGSDVCNVINSDGCFYHFHCHSFINSESKKAPVKGKHNAPNSPEIDSEISE